MLENKLPLSAIQGIAEANQQIRSLTHQRPSRTKSIQILAVRKALRACSLAYEFHDTDKIFVEPRGHRFPPFTIAYKSTPIPRSMMKIQFYFIECPVRQINFSTPCISGTHVINKLLKLRLISDDEAARLKSTEGYEPYKHCKQCGERMRLNDTVCEICSTPNNQ